MIYSFTGPVIPPGPPHTGLGVNGAFFGECLYSLSTAHSHNIPKKLTFMEANDSGKRGSMETVPWESRQRLGVRLSTSRD